MIKLSHRSSIIIGRPARTWFTQSDGWRRRPVLQTDRQIFDAQGHSHQLWDLACSIRQSTDPGRSYRKDGSPPAMVLGLIVPRQIKPTPLSRIKKIIASVLWAKPARRQRAQETPMAYLHRDDGHAIPTASCCGWTMRQALPFPSYSRGNQEDHKSSRH